MYLRCYYKGNVYFFFKALLPIIKKHIRQFKDNPKRIENVLTLMSDLIVDKEGKYVKQRNHLSFGALYSANTIELKEII